MRDFLPAKKPGLATRWRMVLAAVLGLVILVPLTFLGALVLSLSPTSYSISSGALTIRAGDLFAGAHTVRLADLTEVRPVMLSGGRRVAGTVLPGHCTGRFSYSEIGPVWQATDCSARAVLVRANGEARPIVLTPPNPELFIGMLRSGIETTIQLPSFNKTIPGVLAFVLITLGTVAAVMVGALLLLGPKRMRYLVGEGSIEVRTLFGKKRWPTKGARAKEYVPARLRRLAGTSMPGYFTGIFRENGKTVRVYATALDRVILLEGPVRLILSPEDPAALLAALHDEGVVLELGPDDGARQT